MKLYRIVTLHGGSIWAGTQADAKRISKEEHAAGWEDVDVPTDKPNLLSWLNGSTFISGKAGRDEAIDPLEAAELRAVAAATPSPGAQPALTAGNVVAFILDDATVAQVETIFAALGTRFKEQLNGAR